MSVKARKYPFPAVEGEIILVCRIVEGSVDEQLHRLDMLERFDCQHFPEVVVAATSRQRFEIYVATTMAGIRLDNKWFQLSLLGQYPTNDDCCDNDDSNRSCHVVYTLCLSTVFCESRMCY